MPEDIEVRLRQIESDIEIIKNEEAEAELRAKLEDLTGRIQALRSAYSSPSRQDIFNFRVKRGFRYFVNNIGFFAFLATVAIASYVYFEYGVGYFESYENISVTKRSANYYLRTGNVFINRAEFNAAEEAFKTALEINPYNIDARRGLLKAQVLKSEVGARSFMPEIVNAKLNYLQTEEGFRNDPLLLYFQGRVFKETGDRKQAREYFQKSLDQQMALKQDSGFLGNYIELGKLDMYDGEIDYALTRFNTPALINAKQTTVIYHRSECYLASYMYEEVKSQLEPLYFSSPRLETFLILGDAYRQEYASNPTEYSDNIEFATTMDKQAEEMLKRTDLRDGVDYAPLIVLSVPPPSAHRKVKLFQDIAEVEQYRALTNYALSLDYAMSKNFSLADKYFKQAVDVDVPFRDIAILFIDKTRFYEDSTQKLDPGIKKWFEDKRKLLQKLRGDKPEWIAQNKG